MQALPTRPLDAFRSIHPRLALRLAARNLRRQPGVPLAAGLVLAVGYGAAAAIFSVYHGFGGPLPVPEGERVVRLRVVDRDGVRTLLDRDQLRVVRESQDLFAVVGAFAGDSAVLAAEDVPPRRISSAAVTAEVFAALEVAAQLGSWSGAPDEAAISHDLWTQAFASDPDIVGRSVRIGGRGFDVAAVMPVGFAFPFRQQLWILLDPGASEVSAEVVARLADGVSAERAARALQARWRAAFPGSDGREARVLVDGFTEARGEGGEELALLALLSLVVALLLVSCSNVSNLMLARAVARSRSLALHAAIGASPTQVRLQVLTEAVLIALLGAAAGLVVAAVAASYIEGTLAGHWGYYWMAVEMDFAVVAFTLLLAVLTALVAGLLPALRAARADVSTPLKQGARSDDRRSSRISWALLTGQIAFSAAALVVALLMALGLLRTREVEPGFPADRVQVASVVLDGDSYTQPDARQRFRRRLQQRVEESPEIRAAATVVGLPGLNGQWGRLAVDGVEPDPEARRPAILTYAVSERFFEVFDLALLQGRLPLPGDATAAVVSADFARRHLAGNPLGRRIRLAGVDDRWWQVVGVVADVVIYDVARERNLDWAYIPIDQLEPTGFNIVYRAAADTRVATKTIAGAVAELAPDLPLAGGMGGDAGVPVAAVLAFVRRFMQTVGTLGSLGGLAAALVAMIGLYGMLAFEVGRRLPDYGVRLALGAERRQVLGQIVGQALVRTAPGLVVGLVIAWAGAPVFGLFLFGMAGRNPVVFASTALVYLAVAVLAALAPGYRAAAQDPAQVLRGD